MYLATIGLFVLFAVSMALIGLVPPVEWVHLVPCFFVGWLP
ncbi:hypothetical protein [Streptomyces sp. NPDC056987]